MGSVLASTLDGPFETAEQLTRRLGFVSYHTLRSLNYSAELYARPASTPGGTIRTYELMNTHGDDPLLVLVEANAGPTETIYDIGAYVGEYALALAVDQPDRTIVAFEPDPVHCDRFQQNYTPTAPAGAVELRQVGVGAEDTTREFYRSSFPKLSSFDHNDATRWGGTVTGCRPVPIRSLDGLIDELPAPDHIKIDTEGHAPSVLRGATQTIDEHRPILYIETHDRPGADRTTQIREWCDDQGYASHTREGILVCYPPSKSVQLNP